MNPWRALLACGIMTALRSMSLFEDGGIVSVRDADLAAMFQAPGRMAVTENDVKHVRRRLVDLGMLQQVSSGSKGKAQELRLTCYARADAIRTRNGRETDAKRTQSAQRGSGSTGYDGRKTDAKRTQNGRETDALRKGNGKGEQDQIHVPLPTCERCQLDAPACFCEPWNSYREAVKRWDGAAGGRGKALARWEKLKAKDRDQCRAAIASLVAKLNGANPSTHRAFGLCHLSTFINQPKTWDDPPDLRPLRVNQQQQRLIALQGGPSGIPSDPEFFRKRAAQYARENPLPPRSDPDAF